MAHPQSRRRKLLGRILIEMELLHNQQVQEALSVQSRDGGRVGEILCRLGYISSDQLQMALDLQDGRKAAVPIETELIARFQELPGGNSVAARLLAIDLAIACKAGATELVFERRHEAASIRYRVDGALYEMESPPLNLLGPMFELLKQLAGMEREGWGAPQTGRARIWVEAKPYDLRVVATPGQYTETVRIEIAGG